MTLPGYVIAVVAYAALLGAAMALVPATAPGRWLALPGAVALTELLRWSWPFGGVPLSSLAVGQVGGPLAPVLRVGGALLLVEVTVIGGVALAAALRRRWAAAGLAAAVVLVAVGVAGVAPRGQEAGTLRVALVQGGGPQGTRAWNTDEREVFERHLEASEQVDTPVDLVLWPEDVVDIDSLDTDRERGELADLARELDATLVAGVVEDAGEDRFRNASVAFDADGEIVDRYDKVHRVPFGEYVPLRSLLEPFGGESLTSRDAVVGDQPALLETPAGGLSVAISWEIFFGDRVREGVEQDAEDRPQPHQRLVVLGHPGADPAGGVVPNAGHRERPVAAAGGAHRVQRGDRPRRAGPPAQRGERAGRAARDGRPPLQAPRSTPAGASALRWRWPWPAWRPPAGWRPVGGAGRGPGAPEPSRRDEHHDLTDRLM